ncbi:hypothetical protein CDCA_CDCA01G0393 [Cyanidium caldarium]|uniref:Elongation of fatty acids protein n=1 Tax=Cyanidium caldarium TaxID=2771 RepID=A0AAV9IQT5_CYACA|nr:hypothetical protein CDCA_CDCA01G0393 [Cyanidium caldarium]
MSWTRCWFLWLVLWVGVGGSLAATAGAISPLSTSASGDGWCDGLVAWATRLDARVRQFDFAHAPLSHVAYPVCGMLTYLLTVGLLVWVMRKRAPMRLQAAVLVHNVVLCVLSVAMGAGTAVEVFRHWRRSPDGVRAILCDHDGTVMRGRLSFWMYVFYASKYYELLDTVIMILRKRPLSFLHVYHHCVVLPLFWVYMRTSMVIHFILVIANSLVHVFMYYYYAVASLGMSVWWKRHLTMAQIVQFVIDLTATYPFVYFYLRHPRGCSGSMRGFIFGQAVGISFFYLFVDFFHKSYTKRRSKDAGAVPPVMITGAAVEDRATAAAAAAAAAAAVSGVEAPAAAGLVKRPRPSKRS